jgi:hypothetical protein
MASLNPGTKKFFIWSGVITIGIIILIIVLDVVFYSTRKFIFSPYKPQVPDTVKNSAKTLSKAVNPKTYYCPNGCPEDETGVPANYGTLNSTIQSYITNNLNSYQATNPAKQSSDWYYNS